VDLQSGLIKGCTDYESRSTSPDWFKCSTPCSPVSGDFGSVRVLFLSSSGQCSSGTSPTSSDSFNSLRQSPAYLLPPIDQLKFTAYFCFGVWCLIASGLLLDTRRVVAANSSLGVRLSVSRCDGPKPMPLSLSPIKTTQYNPAAPCGSVWTSFDGGCASATPAAARESLFTGKHQCRFTAHEDCALRWRQRAGGGLNVSIREGTEGEVRPGRSMVVITI
jgi:hypothetical protein